MSNATTTDPSTPVEATEKAARTVAFAAFVGTALEWYDYFLYGTAAALVFNRLFFVTKDPLVSTLAAFASFAVGFLARPVGAILFGHLGDRIGRRKTLIVTVVLIGFATGAIGFLPVFSAVGVAAPVLLTLLRLLQGIGVGGEWGGSVLMSMEWGRRKRHGFMASLPQLGVPIG
ncbi:MAG: MFS transporter, partial [Nocardioidaceae bacterium]